MNATIVSSVILACTSFKISFAAGETGSGKGGVAIELTPPALSAAWQSVGCHKMFKATSAASDRDKRHGFIRAIGFTLSSLAY